LNANVEIGVEGTKPILQLISASLEIKGSTHIYNQHSLISSFLSTLKLEDSLLSNIDLDEAGIEVFGSELTLTNINITRINPLDTSVTSKEFKIFIIDIDMNFILAVLDSTLSFTNIQYSHSSTVLFNSIKSKADIDGIQITNTTKVDNLLNIYENYDSNIANLITNDSQIQDEGVILISKSTNLTLNSIDIQNSK